MNPLMGIAKITSKRKIWLWCAVKRNKQWNKKWDKEKAAASTATKLAPLEKV